MRTRLPDAAGWQGGGGGEGVDLLIRAACSNPSWRAGLIPQRRLDHSLTPTGWMIDAVDLMSDEVVAKTAAAVRS